MLGAERYEVIRHPRLALRTFQEDRNRLVVRIKTSDIIQDAKLIRFSTKSMIFDTEFIIFNANRYRISILWLHHPWVPDDGFCIKMMNFVLQMMDFVLTMMDFVLKIMNFVLKMMDFVLKIMNFVFKMMDWRKMLDGLAGLYLQ